jgi:hypothetical protein
MQTFVLKPYWFSSLFAIDKLSFELSILFNTIHRHPQFTSSILQQVVQQCFVVVLIFYSATSVVRDHPALCSKQCGK